MTPSKILPALPLLAAGTFVATPTLAASVTITIPQINVAEYHRPYVAGWVEPVNGGAARTIFVWYDVKKGGQEPGTKWLADMRTWWRKGGSALAMPANGISGATRAPGTYTVPIPANLRPGQYVFKVEAARETGGREIVSVPFSVPARRASASGKTELGNITIR